jgi:hypothetical protein
MKQSYQLEKNILLFYLIEVLKINQIIEVSLIYKVFQEEVTDIINMTLWYTQILPDIENHIKLLNDDSDIPTTKILLKLK